MSEYNTFRCDHCAGKKSKGQGKRALEQNRLLYSEIFNACVKSNGTKRVLEEGLAKLEEDSTFILEFIKLNPMEAK